MDPIIERFIEVWGTPLRGRRLWEAWLTALGDNAEIIEQLAQTESEERGIPLEEAQARMAIEKFAQDRGYDYVTKILHQHEADQLRASRTLQPMASASRKKK
jgi:hypothetical protein